MKSIIIYFSRAGENYYGGEIRRVDTGNTEIAAHMLHELTGAPLFKLEPKNPYSDIYYDAIEEAKADLKAGARPALKAVPQNMADIDTIYLGYPNYWGTMPMAVYTFLESVQQWEGKTIKPFCTHEGSRMGHSEKDLANLCPGAKIERGLAICGSAVQNAREVLDKWK